MQNPCPEQHQDHHCRATVLPLKAPEGVADATVSSLVPTLALYTVWPAVVPTNEGQISQSTSTVALAVPDGTWIVASVSTNGIVEIILFTVWKNFTM